MKRSIELTNLAERQLFAARAWWRRNRDKAPSAFEEEMESALLRLSENLSISTAYRHARRPDVRRYLIERIRYYVYFRVVGDSFKCCEYGTPPDARPTGCETILPMSVEIK